MPCHVRYCVIESALFCAAIYRFYFAKFAPAVKRYGNVQAFSFVVCGAFMRVIAANIFCPKPVISFSFSVESNVYERHLLSSFPKRAEPIFRHIKAGRVTKAAPNICPTPRNFCPASITVPAACNLYCVHCRQSADLSKCRSIVPGCQAHDFERVFLVNQLLVHQVSPSLISASQNSRLHSSQLIDGYLQPPVFVFLFAETIRAGQISINPSGSEITSGNSLSNSLCLVLAGCSFAHFSTAATHSSALLVRSFIWHPRPISSSGQPTHGLPVMLCLESKESHILAYALKYATASIFHPPTSRPYRICCLRSPARLP